MTWLRHIGELEPVPRKVSGEEALRILCALGAAGLVAGLVGGGRGALAAALKVRPDALAQLQQGLGRLDAEARVARRDEGKVGGLAKGDVHLLARGANVEPGERVALQGGHGARREAEGGGVEGGGGGEVAGRDDEVDVVEAADHGCRVRRCVDAYLRICVSAYLVERDGMGKGGRAVGRGQSPVVTGGTARIE